MLLLKSEIDLLSVPKDPNRPPKLVKHSKLEYRSVCVAREIPEGCMPSEPESSSRELVGTLKKFKKSEVQAVQPGSPQVEFPVPRALCPRTSNA
jgi:hypothetical protein